jgi:hypothetical protein
MTVQWKRSAYAIVNDVRVEGLRLKFKARKTIKPDPNTLDLRIYNLAEPTRARLQAAHVPIVLVAGYEGAAQVIFAGESRTVDHVREGADWTTHVQCGDGEVAYRGFSAFSFGPGAKASDVIARIAQDLGVNAGDALARLRKGDYPGALDSFLQGYTATGKSVRELDRVTKAIGLEWSIQDGVLQLLEPDTPTQEEAFVLSPATGLIGSPEHGAPEEQGVAPLLKAKCLLNGALRPGRKVKLETAQRTGFYRLEAVEHEGDSHGETWTSSVEARPQ